MANWVNISDAVIAAGKAIKAITIRQLRDNIMAMAEGAAGAPKISGNAISSYLPCAVTASSVLAENTQFIKVMNLDENDVLTFGVLETDSNVNQSVYTAGQAISVGATHNNGNFYATNTIMTFNSLRGQIMIQPNAAGFSGRDAIITQMRGSVTVFTESYLGTGDARPVLTIEPGDVVTVGIEQNSSAVNLIIRWLPTFRIAYPVGCEL
jgi:hypothetical protein